MNSPAVKIVLDEPAASVPCGGIISGWVNVVAQEACAGRRLIVALGYRSTGSAPTQSIRSQKDTETREIFAGAWEQGAYSYPFSLPVPEACNYAGTIMTITWYLRAGIGTRAATSFDVESEDEQAITIIPADVSPSDRERKRASELVRRGPVRTSPGCFLTSIALVLGGLFFAWLGLEHDASLPGAIAAVAGLAFLGVMIRQALINRKIAVTEMRIGSTVAWPGVEVPCSITLQPKSAMEVECATLKLEGREQVKKFTGMYRSTGPANTHVVHVEERPLEPATRTLSAGVPVTLSGSFAVPASATCTMGFDNELKFSWCAELRITIKGSPDWFDVQPVTVLPRNPEVGS
jgi:hypothetical protein